MKKVVAVIITFMTVFLTCCSSSNSKSALETYEAAIEKVSVITLDSEVDVALAQSAYNALTQRQKKKISDEKITKAKEEFERLQKINTLLPEVCIKLENIFKPGQKISESDFQEDYAYVSENINLLTDEQKAEVKNTERFVTAVQKYESVVSEVGNFAKTYVEKFTETAEFSNAVPKEIACIVNEKDGKAGYYFALKYQDGTQEKTVYSHSAFNSSTDTEKIVKFAEYYYNEKPLSDKYNAFENGNYTLDSASIIASAAG